MHCVGLAREGVHVVSALTTKEKAESARGVYALTGGGANVEVRVGQEPDRRLGPPAERHGGRATTRSPFVEDWRELPRRLGKLARKVLVVTVCNPNNWGVEAIRIAGKLRGVKGLDPPEVWKTEVLSPALWEIGRVREHVYFDAPGGPTSRSPRARASRTACASSFARRRPTWPSPRAPTAWPSPSSSSTAPRSWPYFGGEGWTDELLPALLRHPGFDGATTKLLPRIAHLHAFVVDVRPRNPQGKRRLERAE